ncbi:MAG: hypothetical protein JO146_02640 [Candidatus Eremiobacteraeota bacterium]|nr:hypothetical protein [Candidatus Eremiobacteraeota bacterium]
MSSTMEGRIARLEGAYEQISDRLNGIDARLTGLEHTIDTRFAQVDQRFTWLTGVVIGTWITTILTILFHH